MQGVQVRSLVREIDPTCHRSKIKTFLISIVFWYIFSLFSFFNNNQNSSMTWLSSCSQTMKNNLGSHAKKKNISHVIPELPVFLIPYPAELSVLHIRIHLLFFSFTHSTHIYWKSPIRAKLWWKCWRSRREPNRQNSLKESTFNQIKA